MALTHPPVRNLIDCLEIGQLVSDTSQPLARAVLSKPVRTMLWALRIFALLLSAAVVFAFVLNLG